MSYRRAAGLARKAAPEKLQKHGRSLCYCLSFKRDRSRHKRARQARRAPIHETVGPVQQLGNAGMASIH